MRSIPSLSLGLLIGALASSAVWLALDPRETAADRNLGVRDDAPALAPSQDRGGDVHGEQLARIEARLTDLTAEVSALRAARPGSEARSPVAAATESGLDEVALAAALQRADEQRASERLASMTDQQLLTEARNRGKSAPLEEQALLESLLERPLSTEHRTQALAYLGMLHRKAGDLVASEQALQDAVAAGAGSDDGAWASYELAMTVAASGDHTRALSIVRSVPDTPGISDWNRLHAQWATASFEAQTGNLDAARAGYERIVAECTGTDFDWMAQKAARQLKAIH